MSTPVRSLVVPRIKAFAIDYLIILAYIGLLLGATVLVSNFADISLENVNTTRAELIGFITLTLPAILYFSFTESGKHGGSVGKRIFGLKVVTKNLNRAGFTQLLVRNLIKFLPWEIAHFFVYQLVHRMRTDAEPPSWILAGLTGSQALAVIYLLFIFFNKNNRSIYEIASHTRVVNYTNMKSV